MNKTTISDFVQPSQEDMHIHVCSCGQVADTRFMTGKEWYKRFEKELSGPFSGDPAEILQAVINASEVTHE